MPLPCLIDGAGPDPMRRAARTDANHAAVVQALRKAGCSVTSLAAVGHGVPDLLVGVDHQNLLMEVKDGDKVPSAKKLTPDEATWHAEWRGVVETVHSAEEALQIVGEVRRGIR